VNHDLSVFALAGDVDDKVVGCWISLERVWLVEQFVFVLVSVTCTYDVGAIPASRGDVVHKHKADVGSSVHGRLE
jgi:hypothetical protein